MHGFAEGYFWFFQWKINLGIQFVVEANPSKLLTGIPGVSWNVPIYLAIYDEDYVYIYIYVYIYMHTLDIGV